VKNKFSKIAKTKAQQWQTKENVIVDKLVLSQ